MAQRRIWGTFWHHDADSRFSRTNGTEKLLILSAFDLLGNLRFIQLTVFGSLNLMIDSDQLLLQSILAGRVQHLHCYRSCIRTPNIPQKNFIILRLFCVVTGCQLYKLRKRSDSLCKSQVPTYMAWVKAGCVHLYHVEGKTVIHMAYMNILCLGQATIAISSLTHLLTHFTSQTHYRHFICKQESWSIAKMTMWCTLHKDAVKIFGSPWVHPWLHFPNFLMGFCSDWSFKCTGQIFSP